MSLSATRLPGVVAVAQAGGTTWEVGFVTPDDIDVDRGTIDLPGSARVLPRTNELTPFGIMALATHLERVRDGEKCFSPRSTAFSASVSACQALSSVLRKAHLAHLPNVRIDSIRAWAGRRAYDAHGIEAAARLLGCRSLDTALRIVGAGR
ncbi:MAG: hypothetical protein QOK28_2196 [Actinomycetota bacterium]|jgi:hypothetical protein